MDEPLSNLDAKLRVQTRTEIAALQRRLGTTTVYVTHDQVEAMTMGDRVAVLKDGVLQQVDTPRNLYDRPANDFVAGFIGSPAMNLVSVPLTEGGALLGGRPVALPRPVLATLVDEGSRTATVGFRPEAVEFVGAGEGFPVEVQVVEELGSDAFAYGRLQTDAVPGTAERPLVLRADARRPPAKGEIVHVTIRPGEVHVFSPQTGVRVSDAGS
jgi:multiple sugar transport system ATP-binding protein